MKPSYDESILNNRRIYAITINVIDPQVHNNRNCLELAQQKGFNPFRNYFEMLKYQFKKLIVYMTIIFNRLVKNIQLIQNSIHTKKEPNCTGLHASQV